MVPINEAVPNPGIVWSFINIRLIEGYFQEGGPRHRYIASGISYIW